MSDYPCFHFSSLFLPHYYITDLLFLIYFGVLFLTMIDFIVVLFSHEFYFIIYPDNFNDKFFWPWYSLPVAVLFVVYFCSSGFLFAFHLSVLSTSSISSDCLFLLGYKFWCNCWIECCIIQDFCRYWSWSIFVFYLYLNLTLTIQHYFTLIQLSLFQPTQREQ